MNLTNRLSAAVLAILVVGPVVGEENGEGGKKVWTFQDDTEGKIARGFQEEVGQWKVVMAEGEKVLAQQAKNANSIFYLAFVSDSKAKDIDLSVKMKAVAGELDQGGGLVWRGKDK